MNIVNRIIVSLLSMVLMAVAVIIILVTAGVLDYWFLPWGFEGPGIAGDNGELMVSGLEVHIRNSWLESELRWFSLLSIQWQILTIAAGIGALLALAWLLLAEVRGGVERRENPLLVSFNELGTLNIEPSSVRSLVETVATTNPNVTSLKCRLTVRRKPPPEGPHTVVVSCHPRVEMGADVEGIRDDLQSRIKDSLERLTGLAVERVNITRVRFNPVPKHRLID